MTKRDFEEYTGEERRKDGINAGNMGLPSGNPVFYGIGRGIVGHGRRQEDEEVLSDPEIQERVYDAIAAHPRLPRDPDIAALVEDHIVTLKGEANSEEIKQAVSDIAWATPGVRDVNNEIWVADRREDSSAPDAG